MAAALQPPPQPQKPPINKFIVALFLAKSRPSNSSVRSTCDPASQTMITLTEFGRPYFASRELHSTRWYSWSCGAGIGNVDSVEFWRDSYYKSDAERIEQRVRILALEQQLGRPSAPARATSSQPSMHKKRKRNEDAVEGPNGRVKKTPKTTLNESSPISPDKEIDTIAPGPFASGHREGKKRLKYAVLRRC